MSFYTSNNVFIPGGNPGSILFVDPASPNPGAVTTDTFFRFDPTNDRLIIWGNIGAGIDIGTGNMRVSLTGNAGIGIGTQAGTSYFNIGTGPGAVADIRGVFSNLGIGGTSSNSLIDVSGEWNTTGTPTGIRLNVTDTASNAASLLMDLQVGGASRFRVQKSGAISGNSTGMGGAGSGAWFGANGENFHLDRGTNRSPSYSFFTAAGSYQVRFNDAAAFGWTSGNSDASLDLSLFRDSANTLAQRNGVNAQTLRVYNTFTDASNYERGRFAWASNVLTIGTENAGTGLARELAFITGGVEQARLNSTGFGIGTNSPTSKLEVQGAGVLVSFLSTNNNNVVRIRGNNATNGAWIGTSNADDFIISTGPSVDERVRIPGNGGMVVGTAALATNATNGFLYVAGCAGTPTGTPTAYTGRVPIVVDTTNNKLYFYSGGAWRDAGP